MNAKLKHLAWTEWASISISVLAILLPFLLPLLLPSVFPEGFLGYYPMTIPLGFVAGLFAIKAHNGWLIVFAGVAGFFPLLLYVVPMFFLQFLYVITLGNYPNENWV